jgi:hypothetical protein
MPFCCPVYYIYLEGSVEGAAAGAVPFKVVPKFLNVIHASR